MGNFYLLLFLLFTVINANDEEKFINLFNFLETNNIVLGKDISSEELYKMVEDNKIYQKNGELNKKIISSKLSSLMKEKNEQFDNIRKEINKNPNSKINKEIKFLLDDSNERVEKTIKNLDEEDSDGYFSSVMNFVLGFMKN